MLLKFKKLDFKKLDFKKLDFKKNVNNQKKITSNYLKML